ncbi:uncharacterized protein LOC123442485 [Hordeum vulgare subsp. vulgare]|uniref:Uncharacterized protein n=1 Tax=Hordeum vulgare subsp. vulgare TaxID=112509 RepID=A0A8I6XNS7_HORVV|nr:uncharacterized protein LOC123442485 [Hordeum vulgare subsp. vulgare]XP_044974475.1 uncharacterized protein LOC123442485 [Hordeum vulgare subsp. vulgare]XP_044974476.1 uncharacterized protein LOC123442485 [Hordeum vulgare subsp. vulgare]XP_044974477.1 uncharacterized protein LOC123442485 [Hordeum vulgare subsp. vulgare]XP_044974478.1 uncharacterized protein LOC123442485 [Hordeum vulgare subsp. vulgare]
MIIDFIDLSDHDIIDLSSDDETVQDDQIATHHQATLLDTQTMLVVAGEGSQDEQVVFVPAGEGRQEVAECRHALEATTSFLVTEKEPLVAASEESEGVQAVFVAASEGSEDVQAVFVATGEGSQDAQSVLVATSEGRQEAAECGHALEATTSFLVTEKAPFVAASEGSEDVQAVFVAASEGSEDEKAAFVAASEGSQDVQAVLVAASEGRQEAADSGNALEATTSSLVTGKAPLDMAKSQNRFRSPTSVSFPGLTSTTLKALTSEVENAKLVRRKVKHPRKNYHTGTPRISPRFELKPECSNGPVEELLAEALSFEGGDAELVRVKVQYPGKDYHTSTPTTSPTFELDCECHNGPVEDLPADALTSEDGDAKLVKGKVKHPRMNYHTITPRTSPRFEPKPECRNGPLEELSVEALTPEDSDAKLVREKVKHPRMKYYTGTPRTSPRFVPKLDCHNRHVEMLPAEALTSEGGNEELMRGKVKHPKKKYHAGTPRTSPRFVPKLECHNGHVEELPTEALSSEGANAELVRGNGKYHRKKYHTGTPRTSPRFEQKLDCRNGPVEELPADALTSKDGDAKLVKGKVKHPRMNYHTSTPRTSPRFGPKPECRNGPVEEVPAEALIPEDGDANLVREKVKHPRMKYHTGTPRTSPRFVPKLECHNGHVQELPAEPLTSEGGNEELVRGKGKHPRKKHHTGTPRTSPRFVPKLECHNGHVEELPSSDL